MATIRIENAPKTISAHLSESRAQADRLMLSILCVLFILSLALAFWYDTWLAAFAVGLPSMLVPWLIFKAAPVGALSSRLAVAFALMLFSALLIHQSRGMVEMHFSVFCFLAFLLCYRDWMPIVAAAALIAVHHVAFFFLQRFSVPVWVLPNTGEFWVVLIHAAFVVIETAMLCLIAINMRREAIEAAAVTMLSNMMATGDLSTQIEISGKTTATFQAILEMQTRFRRLMHKIAEGTGTIREYASTLTEISGEMEKQSSAQNGAAVNISSEVKALQASFGIVSRNAEEGNRLSAEAAGHASARVGAVTKTTADMRQIADTITNTAGDINDLGEQTGKITHVVSVIGEIAAQTNLLALNAAIEAARAGEQGRGFAVVADEVRKLAERTAHSTVEIQQMIGLIASSKDKALASMHDLVTSMNGSVMQANETASSIEKITESSRRVAETVNEISTAMHAQLSSTNAIGEQLDEVSSKASANQALVRRSLQLVTSIEGAVDELKNEVTAFNVAKSPQRP